jgi:hypothetical protein
VQDGGTSNWQSCCIGPMHVILRHRNPLVRTLHTDLVNIARRHALGAFVVRLYIAGVLVWILQKVRCVFCSLVWNSH